MDINCTDRELFLFKKIAAAAEELNYPTYLIGGFVRDKILKRNSKDIDVVCVGDGIRLAEAVAKRFRPTPHVSIFKTYGTAQIKLSDVEIEFVGARKESYHLDSRNPEVVPGNLQDDQNRRDFTINALSISLNRMDYGTLVDPFNGWRDLQLKRIVTPLDPDITFSDDPLRMMRAIRFASQLNFKIDDVTFESIQRNAERIKIITQERITDEFNKIMMSKKPSIGLDLLYRSGILEFIFPQMVALAGAENIEGIGHKDNFYHTIQVIDNIAVHTDNLWLRWSALMHDIGKPASKKFEVGFGWTFHSHEVIGSKMVPKIFKALKLPTDERMRFVKKMVFLHMRPVSLTKENISDSAIRRLIFDAGDDVESLMTLCEADITSKNKIKVRKYLQNFELVRKRMQEVEERDKIRNWQPPVNGAMIMDIFQLPPSQEVGTIKDAIREAILDGIIPNEFEASFHFLLEKGAALGLTANEEKVKYYETKAPEVKTLG